MNCSFNAWQRKGWPHENGAPKFVNSLSQKANCTYEMAIVQRTNFVFAECCWEQIEYGRFVCVVVQYFQL